MKTPQLLLLFLIGITALTSKAQMLTDEDVMLSLNPKKLLYIGHANPVEFHISGTELSQLSFRCANGAVQKDSILHITPFVAGEVRLKAYKNGKLIKTADFRALPVPEPVATIKGEYDGWIHVEDLKKAAKLSLKANPDITSGQGVNFPYDSLFTITKFTFSSKSNSGYLINIKTKGNRINMNMIKKLDYLLTGDKIYFEEILAKDTRGKLYQISNIVLKLDYRKREDGENKQE